MNAPLSADYRCECPNGSYGVKHTTDCYEVQIAHWRMRAMQAELAARTNAEGWQEALRDRDKYKAIADLRHDENAAAARRFKRS